LHTTRSITFSVVPIQQTVAAAEMQVCTQGHGLASVPTSGLDYLALQFQDVIGKPMETLSQVAKFASLEWNTAVRSRAEVAVQAAAQRKKKMGGKITYDMEAFGLTEANIRNRLENCARQSRHEDHSTTVMEKMRIQDNVVCMEAGTKNTTNRSAEKQFNCQKLVDLF
jgi:hypothetical protein